jgi:hypothetical protein
MTILFRTLSPNVLRPRDFLTDLLPKGSQCPVDFFHAAAVVVVFDIICAFFMHAAPASNDPTEVGFLPSSCVHSPEGGMFSIVNPLPHSGLLYKYANCKKSFLQVLFPLKLAN